MYMCICYTYMQSLYLLHSTNIQEYLQFKQLVEVVYFVCVCLKTESHPRDNLVNNSLFVQEKEVTSG